MVERTKKWMVGGIDGWLTFSSRDPSMGPNRGQQFRKDIFVRLFAGSLFHFLLCSFTLALEPASNTH